MKKWKRFKQSYLDICFSQLGSLHRKRNPILRVLNYDGYLTRY